MGKALRSLLVLAMLNWMASALLGQEVHLGSRIRVTAPALGLEQTVGSFQGLLRDSLRLDSLVVPLRAISRLEVSGGPSTAFGAGLGIGLSGGFVLGVVAGVAACEEGPYFSQGGCVGAAGLGGAAVGLLLGGMVGSLIKQEKWTGLRLEPLIEGPIAGLVLAFRMTLPATPPGRAR